MLNKGIVKKLEIIFIAFVIYMVLFSTIQILMDGMKEMNVAFEMSNILTILWMFLVSIPLGILDNLILVIVLLAIILASRSFYKAKLDETDFEKNKDYYRDIINDYSISALNYVDNFKLDKKQSYTARLLELEKKKIIKIENGKIIKVNKPTEEADIRFVDSIKNNKVTLPIDEYERLVVKEALDKDLITNRSIIEYAKKSKLFKIIFLLFFLPFIGSFIMTFISMFSDSSDVLVISVVILTVLGSLFTIFFITFAIAYSVNLATDNGYIRTDKGKEINKQLDGLKLFMDEFSNIHKKESKYLVLWDEYLIYSVMFDINKKIQEEYSKYF